jgi:hypothetical protein
MTLGDLLFGARCLVDCLVRIDDSRAPYSVAFLDWYMPDLVCKERPCTSTETT